MAMSSLPKLESLSPLVFRVLGCNPGTMTLQGTNTYLVGSGKKKILVDTGEPRNLEYMKLLKLALKFQLNDAEIERIICTHWHYDHIGGIGSIKREYSTPEIVVNKFQRPNYDEEGFQFVADGETFKTEGATLRTLHTPGHTEDHICLLLEEEQAIFSGDCILGEGTSVVFEDFYTYMKSLNLLLELKPRRIYPGHGPVIDDAVERIESYISHRMIRERQIIDAMKANEGSMTPDEIVKKVYLQLSENLLPAAEINVRHHLSKLIMENRVVKCGPHKYAINYDSGKL